MTLNCSYKPVMENALGFQSLTLYHDSSNTDIIIIANKTIIIISLMAVAVYI